jgi:hypothetical protein
LLPFGSVVKISLLAEAALTLKLLLVVPVRAPSLADSVKAPTLVGIRAENVATPPTAATLVVPVNTPPLLIAIDTVEVSDASRFPNWSCTCTVTAGEIACPAIVLEGC